MPIRIIILTLIVLFMESPLHGQGRYVVSCRPDLIAVSAQIAEGEMGKTEKNNRAPHVDAYNRSVGVPLGSPYCASSQYWCYLEATKRLGLSTKEIPLPRTGLAYNVYLYGKKHGKRSEFTVKPNDHIIWKNPNKHTGHTERVKKVIGNGWVQTYAFNTAINKGTSREGDGNGLKNRNVLAPLGRMQLKGILGVEPR